MSEIITNKLTGKTAAGNVTVTNGTATQKLQEGVIHTSAGVNQSSASWFGTAANNNVATGSLNVSSMTDHSQGAYGLNLTNTAANLYTQKFAGMIGHTNNSITIDDNDITTSRFDFETNDSDSNQTTDHYSTTMVSGDLA